MKAFVFILIFIATLCFLPVPLYISADVVGVEVIDSESSARVSIPSKAGILPAPEPFTLNSYDVRVAAAMLRRAGFIQVKNSDGDSYNAAVKDLRILFVGRASEGPPHLVNRYDILLNGRRLNWNHSYINYGSRMVNLRLLFTYRNERPVPDLPFQH